MSAAIRSGRNHPCFLPYLPLTKQVSRCTPISTSLYGNLGSVLPICVISVIRGQFPFGAREATIFSKRGSPRSGSHHGISFRSP